jgi:lipopolysaccharide transport system permease protein
MFFSAAVISCGNSLVTNAQLITKVYFPRVIVPLATIGARLVDFAISLVILAGLMYYYRIPLTWKIAALPFFVIALTALALAVGMLTSAWNVKYRDVGIMLPVLVQLWMFVSPIVYPIEIVPERWRRLYALNPLAGLIGGFRALLLNRELDLMALLMSVATIVSLLVYALYVFRRMQRNFADII